MTGEADDPILLSVDSLAVDFPTPEGYARAVDQLSFSVGSGRTLGIVGESGSGKTATVMAILGLLESARVSGSVLFDGRELLGASERSLESVRGAEIAMVFQDPMTSLNPTMRIGRQVAEPLIRHRGWGKQQAARRVAELLDEVSVPRVEAVMRAYPHQLSGGMLQRVAIAMALSCEPKLLLADEPTTALDVVVQAEVLDLIKAMQEAHNMAVVLITHDMGVVAHAADDVLVMYAGESVEEAEVSELLAHPEHPYTEGLLGAMPNLHSENARQERLTAIPGNPPGLLEMPDGCRFAPRCPHAEGDFGCGDGTGSPPLKSLRPGHKVRTTHAATERRSETSGAPQ